jgi:hypothetical protein
MKKEKSEKTNRKSKQHSYKRKSDLKYYLTHFILSKIEDVDFATVSVYELYGLSEKEIKIVEGIE